MLVATPTRPAKLSAEPNTGNVKLNSYVFVLWGDRFEEAAAAIFVTELRKAGLLVKLVGLNARRIRGANGLILLPDLTLRKALPLAAKATCVVVPAKSADLKILKNDPRLQEFMQQARANAAKLVLKSSSEAAVANDYLFSDDSVIPYPEDDEVLVAFVRTLAGLLTMVR